MNLQKQALGRLSQLGYLYDERTDSFSGISLFNCELDPNAITKTPIPFTDISHLICGSRSEKLQKLSVDAQLKLSLLSGLVSLEGTGKYLSTPNYELSNQYSADLFYQVTTVKEELDIAKMDPDEIDNNSLRTEATHVVVGIKWGFNLIGSFEYEAKDGETKQDIVG